MTKKKGSFILLIALLGAAFQARAESFFICRGYCAASFSSVYEVDVFQALEIHSEDAALDGAYRDAIKQCAEANALLLLPSGVPANPKGLLFIDIGGAYTMDASLQVKSPWDICSESSTDY